MVSSNPMQSVAVGGDNTTSSVLSYLVSFSVYNNSTQLFPTNNSVLTDDQYRVELPTSPHPGVTIVKETSSTLRFNIASGTVFPENSIVSLIDITVGPSNIILKSSFTIVPIKTAEDATSLSLSADSNVVKYDAFGNLVTPTTITATAVQQNYTETITWSSVPVGIVSGTGTLKTLNTAELFSAGNTSVKIKVVTPNGLSDETTIVKVVDGAPGTPGSQGAPGINGTSGLTPRLLELVNGGQYENGQDFIDYAYYRSNDVNEGWYTVKVVGGVRTVVTYTGGLPDTSPTGSWVKAPFTKEMSFGTVIAEQANLAGFIFRNRTLNSQDVSYQSCTTTNDRGPFPNLSLDGKQGIIKFLERLFLDKDGIVMKDDCGNPRIKFGFDNAKVPILQFLNEDGTIKWEAGKNGYQVIVTGTQPSKWNSFNITRITGMNSYSESANIEVYDTDLDEYVVNNTVMANIQSELNSRYQIIQFSCSGPTTTATPYRLVWDTNAFNTLVHEYEKGDMAADVNNYTGIYLNKTPILEAGVNTAPTGTFPDNGWYLIEGISGVNRIGSGLCTATQGVFRFMESYLEPNDFTIHGFTIIRIGYIKNGRIVRTVNIIEKRDWQKDKDRINPII